jgi:hypothetical protein
LRPPVVALIAVGGNAGFPMSHVFSGLVGASLVALTLGFGQFAVGGDLTAGKPDAATAVAIQNSEINRAAKGDRVAASTQTTGTPAVVIKVDGLERTSVAIKPEVQPKKEARDAGRNPRGEVAKRAVACEAVVSVLTEVARQLEPGRCVT